MANSPQAKKRIRQNNKARLHNAALRSRMRTAMKSTLKTIQQGEHAAAAASYKVAQKAIDSMVTKGLIAINTASRYKSKLNKKVKSLAA